jgi:AraC-like DNA-binding protein
MTAAVYCIKVGSEVVYVGQSHRVEARIRRHGYDIKGGNGIAARFPDIFRGQEHTAELLEVIAADEGPATDPADPASRVARIDWECRRDAALNGREMHYIRTLRPRCNRVGLTEPKPPAPEVEPDTSWNAVKRTAATPDMPQFKLSPKPGCSALLVAKDFLRENALRGATFRDAAALIGMSPFHFHREFKKAFGTTPKDVTLAAQVAEAKRLLLDGMPAGEVAARCGFAHHSHFISRFKAATGETPGHWISRQPLATTTTTTAPLLSA